MKNLHLDAIFRCFGNRFYGLWKPILLAGLLGTASVGDAPAEPLFFESPESLTLNQTAGQDGFWLKRTLAETNLENSGNARGADQARKVDYDGNFTATTDFDFLVIPAADFARIDGLESPATAEQMAGNTTNFNEATLEGSSARHESRTYSIIVIGAILLTRFLSMRSAQPNSPLV